MAGVNMRLTAGSIRYVHNVNFSDMSTSHKFPESSTGTPVQRYGTKPLQRHCIEILTMGAVGVRLKGMDRLSCTRLTTAIHNAY